VEICVTTDVENSTRPSTEQANGQMERRTSTTRNAAY